MSSVERQPHAVLDLPSRKRKAEKIERLLALPPTTEALDFLEVGTGSGGIAGFFGTHPRQLYRVTSVDVVDSRVEFDGYQFVKVDDALLPFPDHSFDVVVSNHVIEHVGDRSAQALHLAELRRVMRPGGCGYLAVPNRWMVVEPHYRLVFLSWLPRSWRSTYLEVVKGIRFYDCEPLTLREIEALFVNAGLGFSNQCQQAAFAMVDIEPGNFSLRIYCYLPARVRQWLLPVMPTLIYRLSRDSS